MLWPQLLRSISNCVLNNLFSSQAANNLKLAACEYLGVQFIQQIKTWSSVDAHQEVATVAVGWNISCIYPSNYTHFGKNGIKI